MEGGATGRGVAVDGRWSRCGIDTFMMPHTGDRWRIAALV